MDLQDKCLLLMQDKSHPTTTTRLVSPARSAFTRSANCVCVCGGVDRGEACLSACISLITAVLSYPIPKNSGEKKNFKMNKEKHISQLKASVLMRKDANTHDRPLRNAEKCGSGDTDFTGSG